MGRTGDKITMLENRVSELESKLERLWHNYEIEQARKDFANAEGLTNEQED